MGDVEQKCAGGFLHIHGIGAAKTEADIIFWAEDMGDAGENLGLMFADPENFCQREVGKRGIAGELDDVFSAELGVQPVTLGTTAGVAPDQRWPKNLPVGVEQDSTVHLAGQPDGSDVARQTVSDRQDGADGFLGSTPPVFRILFCPAWKFGLKGDVFGGVESDNFSCFIDQNGAGTTGTNINS